ncbi:Phosphatidate cytidylyltransferase [Alkalibacterium sp. AK22]|uniref:phosphatidate cytidylyltransferase n=1 Tax=Alkalibacterium sp. AK22 TaxID=1229520 RepID=UPI00044BB1FA|nr:phosphatidate cytidylyltransferase [Alkalibacterium sp. AK22]EXJ24137.1 Phosphatidate cytidylyltransferase [Alkalibacterium sp. AK22]
MSKRVITAVIALMLFIPIVGIGSWPLEVLMGLAALLGQTEFIQMNKLKVGSFPSILTGSGALAIVFSERLQPVMGEQVIAKIILLAAVLLLAYSIRQSKLKISQIGILTLMMTYIGIGFHSFVALRDLDLTVLVLVLIVIWVTDSGAFLIGREWGKNKLAPTISPNKTIEGAVGGTGVATLVSAVYLVFFPLFNSYLLSLGFTVLVSAAGQLGDLIESKIKREHEVKDSGNLLPGHGGILDRFDSLLLVLNVLFLIGLL